ncbi:MAG: GreA/GreB family elongation factor, partial [Pseudarthrobacter sp.]
VDLEDLDTGQVVTYQIVGDDEADLKAGKISISSPIARRTAVFSRFSVCTELTGYQLLGIPKMSGRA